MNRSQKYILKKVQLCSVDDSVGRSSQTKHISQSCSKEIRSGFEPTIFQLVGGSPSAYTTGP